MNKFVGLPFMCLMFLSTYASPEISGSSWSLQLSQSNEEPVQVQMERKEFDENGETSYTSEGTIEDGVYKPTNEFKDFTPKESQFESANKLHRKSRDIDALIRIADQHENEEMNSQKNEREKEYYHGRDFGSNVEDSRCYLKRKHFGKRSPWKFWKKKRVHPKNENLNEEEFAAGRYQPREVYGWENTESEPRSRRHSRKHFEKHNPWKFWKMKHFHPRSDESAKEKSRYAKIPDSESEAILGSETVENELKNLLKFLQMENIYSKLTEFVKGQSYDTEIPDSESEAIKSRLKNRSRVAPMELLKEYWKKLPELKKQNSEDQDDSKRSLRIIRIPARVLSPEKVGKEDFSEKGNWFEDFERQNSAETEELLKSMREFEEGTLFDEYYDAEK